jgi:uncharacterized protein (DUF2345 family)
MSPKPGTTVSLVPPLAPTPAVDAAEGTSGEITTASASPVARTAGPLTARAATPHRPPQTQAEREENPSWVEIELIDDDGQPVPGARYRVTLPDGTVDEGTLDGQGRARIEGFEPGDCQIEFPDFDGREWDTP